MDGVGEVTAFLTKLGLEQCVQAVVHNGFYTSMEALRGATYEEAPSHTQPVPVPRATFLATARALGPHVRPTAPPLRSPTPLAAAP